MSTNSVEITIKVLVVTQDEILKEQLKKALASNRFEVVFASSSFEAGVLANENRSDCIVVDFSIGMEFAADLCRAVRNDSDFKTEILVAIRAENGSSIELGHGALNEQFTRPLDSESFARTLYSFGIGESF